MREGTASGMVEFKRKDHTWGLLQSPRAAHAGEDGGELAETKRIEALLKKIGPHAEEGTKLARDNREALATCYRTAAKQIREMKKEEVPRNLELPGLLCIPTAYGWPESRPFGKGSNYTGVITIFESRDYEVAMDVWPESAKAKIVLEVDGEVVKGDVHPNKSFRVKLDAGVRTDDDVNLHFRKLRVDQVAE